MAMLQELHDSDFGKREQIHKIKKAKGDKAAKGSKRKSIE